MNRIIRRFINFVRLLMSFLLVRLFHVRHERAGQENLYTSRDNREGLLSDILNSGGHRRRVVHDIGPLASSDGTSWDEEYLNYWDGNTAIHNEIEHRQVRRCDCGAILGYNNHILGTCMVCGGVVCQSEGCAKRCEYCSSLVCGKHAIKYREHTFCSRHRSIAWWRLFWGYM